MPPHNVWDTSIIKYLNVHAFKGKGLLAYWRSSSRERRLVLYKILSEMHAYAGGTGHMPELIITIHSTSNWFPISTYGFGGHEGSKVQHMSCSCEIIQNIEQFQADLSNQDISNRLHTYSSMKPRDSVLHLYVTSRPGDLYPHHRLEC